MNPVIYEWCCLKPFCINEAVTLSGLCDGHDLLRSEDGWKSILIVWSMLNYDPKRFSLDDEGIIPLNDLTRGVRCP